jgi:putative NIF3 family GTP cyclohydrolase 1 type 2
MAEPLDAITAIHNALRGEMQRVDATALDAARGKSGLALAAERFQFFNEVLVWHHQGEELGIFPVMEKVAPSVAEAYQMDHHALDAASNNLSAAVSAHDLLETARATAAFKFHLDLHLDKEEAHLYRLMRERTQIPEQAKAVGVMATTVPPQRFPELVAWMLPLLGHPDRENMTRIWQAVLPAERFEFARQLIQKSLSSDDWAELTRRIPTLNQD